MKISFNLLLERIFKSFCKDSSHSIMGEDKVMCRMEFKGMNGKFVMTNLLPD